MCEVEEDDDYDPLSHRDVHRPLTNCQFFIHLLKGAVGTGILAMPENFKTAGLISGTVILCITGFIVIHCLLLTVRVQNDRAKMLKVPIVTYGQAMKYALEDGPPFLRPLAPASPLIIDCYLSAYHLGTCIVYVVFVAVNIQQVFDTYVVHFDERIWMVIILPFMMAFNCLRDLRILAPVSTLANVIMFTGIGIIMYYVFIDLHGFQNRLLFGSPIDWPGLFGAAVFSLSPIALVLTLESQMLKPQSFGGFCGMLNIGMSLVVAFNIFVAFFGFLKYGEDTQPSLSLNIPRETVVPHVVRSLYASVIFLSYALQFYIPYDIIWNRYTKDRVKKHVLVYDYVFKMSMVIMTFFIAIVVPLLSLFLSLVGVMKALMAIAFPALMSICHYYPDRYGPYKISLWKDITIFIIGIIILVTGTTNSVVRIFIAMKNLYASHEKE